MNRLPTLIKNNFQKMKPYEQVMAVGGTSGGVLGWGMAVNEASKSPCPIMEATITVPVFTAFGLVCGTFFPPAVPTVAAIKGLQWLRSEKKHSKSTRRLMGEMRSLGKLERSAF